MSALTAQRRRARLRARGCEGPGDGAGEIGERARSLFEDASGGPTLDDLLSDVWSGLEAHRGVRCPLCGGEMAPSYVAHTEPVGGRCGDCGTTLG